MIAPDGPPAELRQAIDAVVARRDPRRVERAARELSDAYRGGASRAARDADSVAAYLVARAPATYAAAGAVFGQVAAARPGWAPSSVLDLGAGPGVATWAALAAWPGIEVVQLVEVEPAMAAAGREIAAAADLAALRQAQWAASEPGRPAEAGRRRRADLVVASYVLGELDPAELERFVGDAWERTADTLVVVEPGTTAGYRRMLAARDGVLAAGGSVLAPCPHARPCPLPDGDWCHFGVRLVRSAAHRRAKGAERGFEDEKLSFVVLTRGPQPPGAPRVLRRPGLRPGHVVLELCTADGLERRTVSKKQGDEYRRARKLAWGDALR